MTDLKNFFDDLLWFVLFVLFLPITLPVDIIKKVYLFIRKERQ